jgi:hypothetical protein
MRQHYPRKRTFPVAKLESGVRYFFLNEETATIRCGKSKIGLLR